jgi:hypothetical protein
VAALAPATGAEPLPPRRAARPWLALIFGHVPEFLTAALAGYAVVAMVFVDAQHFQPLLVLVVGLVVGLPVGAAAVLLSGGGAWSRSRLAADGGAVLLAAGFALVNIHYSGQDLSLPRDPTTYTLAGLWLAHHPSALVDPQSAVFGPAAAHLKFAEPGLGAAGHGLLYLQGSHLLPALLATAVRLAGPTAAFSVNPVVGAIALLAVYGFARRLVSPVLALVAVVGLAATLPMLIFSRENYVEPLQMALLFGGLTLLWIAVERGHVALWLLAGLALGDVPLAHADGLFVVVPLLAFAVLALMLDGRHRTWQVAAFLVAIAAGTTLSVIDLRVLSIGYYHLIGHEIRLAALGCLVVVVVGPAAVALARRPVARRRLAAAARRAATPAAALVLVAVALLGSRPWWLVSRHPAPAHYLAGIALLQRAQHLPVDPTRTYTEQTLDWIGWNTGWFVVGLAALGTALLVRRLLRHPAASWAGFLFLYLSVACVYLLSPHITPVQLWADRRLLWAVYPGVFVTAVVALSAALDFVRARSAQALAATAAAVAAVAVVAWPVAVSAHLFTLRPGWPAASQVDALCRAIGPRSAVVVVGPASTERVGALRTYCDVPAGQLDQPSRPTLAALQSAVAAHGRQLFLVSATSAGLPPTAGPFSVVFVTDWAHRLIGPVETCGTDRLAVFIGAVEPGGRVRTLPDRGPIQPAPTSCA